MISFNFSQIIKALRNLWSVNFSLAYLSYVSTSYYFLNCKKKSREITDVHTKIQKSLTKDLWLQCEIEQICCHEKVKHC